MLGNGEGAVLADTGCSACHERRGEWWGRTRQRGLAPGH